MILRSCLIPTLRRLEQVHGYTDKITLEYEVRLPTPSKKKKKHAILGSFVDAVSPWIKSPCYLETTHMHHFLSSRV